MVTKIPSTVALTMDQYLEGDPILTFLMTPHPALSPLQTLDTPTAHQKATIMDPPSPGHSWRVISTSNLMRWRYSMKPPEGVEEFGVSAIHTLHDKN